MAANVSSGALKLLGRSLALTCSLAMGTVAAVDLDSGMVQRRAVLGDPQQAGLREDWRNPAYWGLKKGAYIPKSENCMGGTFEAPYHNKHKEFDFEMCAKVLAYGETLEEATIRYR